MTARMCVPNLATDPGIEEVLPIQNYWRAVGLGRRNMIRLKSLLLVLLLVLVLPLLLRLLLRLLVVLLLLFFYRPLGKFDVPYIYIYIYIYVSIYILFCCACITR